MHLDLMDFTLFYDKCVLFSLEFKTMVEQELFARHAINVFMSFTTQTYMHNTPAYLLPTSIRLKLQLCFLLVFSITMMFT